MKKKIIIAAFFIVVLLIAAYGISRITKITEAHEININVTVVYPNGNHKSNPISTDKKYLADALLEANLISEFEHHSEKYTVIDNISTNYEFDASWWCLTINGKITNEAMNKIKISDGDEYIFEYTVG